MSKYLPHAGDGLYEIVEKYGFNFIKLNCKIYPGKVGPSTPQPRLVINKLSDLMPYYTHEIFHIEFNKPKTGQPKPIEIWISSKSYAEIARSENSPSEEFEKMESVLALEINIQRGKENMEEMKASDDKESEGI